MFKLGILTIVNNVWYNIGIVANNRFEREPGNIPPESVEADPYDMPMHFCWEDACGQDKVYPLWWEEIEGSTTWHICLVCPDCGSTRENIFTDAAVSEFEDEVSDAIVGILHLADELRREAFEDTVELLLEAFERDLIGPDDFK